MKSTPSSRDSIIVLTALPPPPPTPITLILGWFAGSSSNSRSAILNLLQVPPIIKRRPPGSNFLRLFFHERRERPRGLRPSESVDLKLTHELEVDRLELWILVEERRGARVHHLRQDGRDLRREERALSGG